jgi:hypothetical protein
MHEVKIEKPSDSRGLHIERGSLHRGQLNLPSQDASNAHPTVTLNVSPRACSSAASQETENGAHAHPTVTTQRKTCYVQLRRLSRYSQSSRILLLARSLLRSGEDTPSSSIVLAIGILAMSTASIFVVAMSQSPIRVKHQGLY